MKSALKVPNPDSTAQVESLHVVGAGVMGQGIARLFADADISVTLTDTREIAFAHPGTWWPAVMSVLAADEGSTCGAAVMRTRSSAGRRRGCEGY